ncbi:hypothetical protein LJB42_003363 [Komagataella kurtzmanii]|nr:hypothetical protein LJB42_003363 [Komagataella kurtzmanii]
MHPHRRYISFQAIKSIFSSSKSSNEVLKPIKKLPTVSGAGPFSEPATFDVIGNPNALLNVKLPSSTVLNLQFNNQQNNIVAVNGDISQLHTELGKLGTLTNSFLYQRCFNINPISLLLSSASTNANFLSLKTSEKDQWSVVNKSSLVAWSGNGLTVEPSEKGLQLSGKGVFALSHPGNLFEIKLLEGESIYLAPSTIVAYDNLNPFKYQFINNRKVLLDISIPEFNVFSKLKASINAQWKKINAKLTSKTEDVEQELVVKDSPKSIERANQFLGYLASFYRRFLTNKADELMVEFKGPQTLIVSNDLISNRRYFTGQELADIFSKQTR